jgi:hypothetical protein
VGLRHVVEGELTKGGKDFGVGKVFNEVDVRSPDLIKHEGGQSRRQVAKEGLFVVRLLARVVAPNLELREVATGLDGVDNTAVSTVVADRPVSFDPEGEERLGGVGRKIQRFS